MAGIRIRPATRRRAILISAPILLIVASAALLPVAIRAATHGALAALGIQSRGGSVSLGVQHVRIAEIEVGRRGRMTVAATFSPASLLRGRLETIEILDAELYGTAAFGKPEIDGFSPPASEQAAAGPIDLPADKVEINGALLQLQTPAGELRLTADGTVLGGAGSLRLDGRVGIGGALLTGDAPVTFSLTQAGWSLALAPIRIAFTGDKPGAANSVGGQLSLTGTPSGTTADGELKGENLNIRGMPIRTLSLIAKADAGGLSGRFMLKPQQAGNGIDATLMSDVTGTTATLRMDFGEIASFGKPIGTTMQGPVRTNLTVHADPPSAGRPITVDLAHDGMVPGGVILHNARLKAAGMFDSSRSTLTLTACAPFSLDGVELGSFRLQKVSGCLGPAADRPLFGQDAENGFAVAGTIGNLSASVGSANGVLAQAKFAALEIAASVARDRLTGLAANLTGGAVELPGLGAGLHDLGLKANVAQDGALMGTLAGSFGPATKAPTLPVAGNLAGRLDSPALTATLGSLLKFSLAGQIAKLDIPPTELGAGGIDLLRLLPGLAAAASKLSGTFGGSLSADWSGSALKSGGMITLKDVAGTTPNFSFGGLDGTIALASLSPLATADSQVLTMTELVAGIPLTDGRITFGLDRHNRLNIADAHWTLAGGRIGTYDQQLDLYGPDQNLGLVVKGVDLAELLKLVQLEGLSAEGTVEGVIPLRRTKDIIRIEHGVLQTSAPGVIRYDPAETPSFLRGQPGEGTAILRDALKDFRYRQLSLTIDGLLGGEEQIKVSLNGANPTLYGGVPVALNVNLSGALDSIARSSIEAYTNPTKTVHRKLQTKPGDKK